MRSGFEDARESRRAATGAEFQALSDTGRVSVKQAELIEEFIDERAKRSRGMVTDLAERVEKLDSTLKAIAIVSKQHSSKALAAMARSTANASGALANGTDADGRALAHFGNVTAHMRDSLAGLGAHLRGARVNSYVSSNFKLERIFMDFIEI